MIPMQALALERAIRVAMQNPDRGLVDLCKEFLGGGENDLSLIQMLVQDGQSLTMAAAIVRIAKGELKAVVDPRLEPDDILIPGPLR